VSAPLRVYAYAGCDSCRKALKFLAEHGVAHEVVPIREQPPTVAELRTMLGYMGDDLRRLFNTSGQDYRAIDLKTKLPHMSEDDALRLLAANGNLVKRPFALGAKTGITGFQPAAWRALFVK
jgi:arsenate reductase (glutaredoxin)